MMVRRECGAVVPAVPMGYKATKDNDTDSNFIELTKEIAVVCHRLE